ncbi:hypothetical protein DFAR_3630016 [Desulfarculales bacterium]
MPCMGRCSWWVTKRREAYLFAFIDDMSRMIVHAEFYLSEGLATYL